MFLDTPARARTFTSRHGWAGFRWETAPRTMGASISGSRGGEGDGDSQTLEVANWKRRL